MIFIINGLKYDTEKMEKVADVKKWYEWSRPFFNGLGHIYNCELYKSSKGNWLLIHVQDNAHYGEVIDEEEAKDRLMRYDMNKYEELYGEIPEA